MPNRTIYFSDSDDCFCRTKIPNFKKWLKDRILDEREKQRENNVPKLKHEYHYAKNKKKAEKDALSVLIQRCHTLNNTTYLDSFLTGATGKRLLRDADMNLEQFKTHMLRRNNQI